MPLGCTKCETCWTSQFTVASQLESWTLRLREGGRGEGSRERGDGRERGR